MLTTTFVASIVIGLIRRGSLRRFGDLSLRGLWLVILAFGLQVALRVGGYGGPLLSGALYAATYVLLVVFIVLNRSRRELAIMGVGLLSNALVIWANGGRMPVSAAAYQAAVGTALPLTDPTHIPLTETARLAWLSDLWALKPPFPLPGVFSLGDVVVCLGLFLLVQHVMVRPAAPPPEAHAAKA
ncbi:MAG: DUF5317 domain-containing protein [Bacillota bacterium]